MANNPYLEKLRAVRDQRTHKLSELGDQWRTPDWLFLALNELYGPLVLDCFTDGQNAKTPAFFTAEDNALRQDWKARLDRIGEDFGTCFYNPPYSRASQVGKQYITGMRYIMAKVIEEHKKGAPSVGLVKTATSEVWWPANEASQVIHIQGRISYDPPHWYRPEEDKRVAGAGFPASIIIMNGTNSERKKEAYISREELMEIGKPLAEAQAAKRKEWVDMWDDI